MACNSHQENQAYRPPVPPADYDAAGVSIMRPAVKLFAVAYLDFSYLLNCAVILPRNCFFVFGSFGFLGGLGLLGSMQQPPQ